MSDLKPCPFCGGGAPIVHHGPLRDYLWSVDCPECDCEGPIGTKEEYAIKAWNTRTAPWKPIETAPKDGTLILAMNIDKAAQNPVVLYWDTGAEVFDILPHWRTSTHESVPGIDVTHWTPLPDMPKETGND